MRVHPTLEHERHRREVDAPPVQQQRRRNVIGQIGNNMHLLTCRGGGQINGKGIFGDDFKSAICGRDHGQCHCPAVFSMAITLRAPAMSKVRVKPLARANPINNTIMVRARRFCPSVEIKQEIRRCGIKFGTDHLPQGRQALGMAIIGSGTVFMAPEAAGASSIAETASPDWPQTYRRR